MLAGCLAIALAAAPQASAGAAVHRPAPVYRWYAHPQRVSHPHAYPQGYTGSETLYYICLSHATSECLAASPDTILIWISIGEKIFDVIWKIYTDKQGRETPQDKGDTEGKGGKSEPDSQLNQCLDGKQSGSDRAVFTTNCFGNNLSSWIPRATNPPATEYNLWNYESALKAGRLSNLLATTRDSSGADVYNAKNRSGLWATWGYWAAGTCTGC